jgi:hypothetical protein
VALIVATVALTLWWTDDTETSPQRLTVKRVVSCLGLPEGASSDAPTAKVCAEGIRQTTADACSSPGVEAVEVTVQYETGDGLPTTITCESLSS